MPIFSRVGLWNRLIDYTDNPCSMVSGGHPSGQPSDRKGRQDFKDTLYLRSRLSPACMHGLELDHVIKCHFSNTSQICSNFPSRPTNFYMQEKRLSPSRFFRWQCMWMHVNLRRSQTAPTNHFMLKGCRHLFTGKLCLSFWISALSQIINYKFRPPYRNMYCYHILYYYVTIFWLRPNPAWLWDSDDFV